MGLVFVPLLDKDHKPLAFWLPFISIVLPLAYCQKPKVRDWKPTLEIFNEIQLQSMKYLFKVFWLQL